MPLNKRGEKFIFFLIPVLIISQIYFTSIASVVAVDVEHSHVLFQDDFEDGVDEVWGISIPSDAPLGSAWAVELVGDNHVLSLKERVEFSGGSNTLAWTNYTLEVQVKLITPAGGHIGFRAGGHGGYCLAFRESGLLVSKWVPSLSTEMNASNEGLNLNTWFALRIVCVGNSIEVYVDGMVTLSFIDEEDPLLYGGVGFEGLSESHTFFDNFKASTTHRLFVTHLIKEAEDEINKARVINADTVVAEVKLAEAKDSFNDGDLSWAELSAKEAINLAQHSPVGYVSVNELLKHSAKYNKHAVEVLGTIRNIRFEQPIYSFTVDDGTGAISTTLTGPLEEIKTDDEVKVVGMFEAFAGTVIAKSLEKMWSPTEELTTFLIFKDDFEDGDFADWSVDINPDVEGSGWKVEKENSNLVLSGEGRSEAWAGDPEWTDYILEFKMKLIKGSIHTNFRVTDRPEHLDRYILHLSNTYMSLTKETFLKGIGLDLDPDAWHHLKIVCLEKSILVLFNDHLKLEYTDEDNPLLSGYIGFELLTYDHDRKPGHVLFDDIKVAKIATTSVVNDLIIYAQSEIDEEKYRTLNKRIEGYLKEVKEEIAGKSAS